MPLPDYLHAMLVGYLITVAVETAVLLVGVSRRHPVRVRLFAGIWLSACTYPVVWFVLPPLLGTGWQYLLAAETFAPLAECGLFWFAFCSRQPPDRAATRRDLAAVVLANLASFGIGELYYALIR